ncbi:MICOS complex subunit MIC19 [Uranotaenia lowii]|uniref:MICOS complex subunit MIC19 n=1 Tax=Uranotaenia lowii TaxID=190385 RepID=UPI0024790D97|nr:MICOS complex subunit MIC19 [Uranotaenia lowii]
MGAASSTSKTVTVDNDSPVGVIEISEDVVNRIKSGLHPKEVKNQPSGEGKGPSSYPNPMPPSTDGIYGEPSITSMQVLRQKEQELRANDIYWTKRLQNLESNLKKTNQILEKEYNDAIVDVKKRFESSAVDHQLPPCQELKAKVIDCYKKNHYETLQCAPDVKAFTDCVDIHRIQQLQVKSSTGSKTAAGK